MEKMMKRRVLMTGLIFIFLIACVSTPPTVVPTVTIVRTSTPSWTPTATPVIVDLRVKDKLVNCRFGPGTVYELISELNEGQSVHAIGRDESSTWWYVRDPGNPDGLCWVSRNVTEVQGLEGELPVISAPVSFVTKAKLRAEPDRISVNCDKFPQTIFLEAEITTNGPTFVTWRWEASTGVSSENAILVFEESGTKIINDYYQVGGPDDYRIKLHILQPNEIVEQVTVPASCTP
jgi:SH3-like domain-containing protein